MAGFWDISQNPAIVSVYVIQNKLLSEDQIFLFVDLQDLGNLAQMSFPNGNMAAQRLAPFFIGAGLQTVE